MSIGSTITGRSRSGKHSHGNRLYKMQLRSCSWCVLRWARRLQGDTPSGLVMLHQHIAYPLHINYCNYSYIYYEQDTMREKTDQANKHNIGLMGVVMLTWF